MATRNNNLSPIPFYSDLGEQDFRKPWAYGQNFQLLVDKDYLIPFFYCFAGTTTRTVSTVKLYKCVNGSFVEQSGTWKQDLLDNGLALRQVSGYTVLYYPADEVTELDLDDGAYYLQITLNSQEVVYSEVFSARSSSYLSNNCIEVQWHCENDIAYNGGVWMNEDYMTGKAYLPTEIGMPEYPFEEEGESRNGYFFPTKQISYKKYKFVACAPEYLCDAMRLVRMMDTIVITDTLQRNYEANSFTLNDPEWLENGHYAKIECEFTTDTVIKVVGRNNS